MATEGEPSVTMGGSFQQPPEEENEDNAPNSSNFVDEREDLKQELSMTMGISDIDRDLMKVDDTGIYALIAQLSHKILNLEKQLQNPPWFDKVMENVNRIDQFGEKMEIVQEAVTSLSRRINGIHGEEESDEEDAEDAPTATATATATAAAAATAAATARATATKPPNSKNTQFGNEGSQTLEFWSFGFLGFWIFAIYI